MNKKCIAISMLAVFSISTTVVLSGCGGNTEANTSSPASSQNTSESASQSTEGTIKTYDEEYIFKYEDVYITIPKGWASYDTDDGIFFYPNKDGNTYAGNSSYYEIVDETKIDDAIIKDYHKTFCANYDKINLPIPKETKINGNKAWRSSGTLTMNGEEQYVEIMAIQFDGYAMAVETTSLKSDGEKQFKEITSVSDSIQTEKQYQDSLKNQEKENEKKANEIVALINAASKTTIPDAEKVEKAYKAYNNAPEDVQEKVLIYDDLLELKEQTDYIKNCETYDDYKDIQRHPEKYEGLSATITGECKFIINHGNEYSMSVFTDGNYGNGYDVTYKAKEGAPRILSDDVVQLYGQIGGISDITGNPEFNVKYAYIIQESK